jgi:hypothetical protein
MRNTKLAVTLLSIMLAVSIVIMAHSPAVAQTSTPTSKIIKIHGKGFIEEKASGLKVLHLKGTAYERGYQHGMLLADEISETLSAGVTMFALSLGKGDYEAGLEKLVKGKELMEPFVPPEFKQEIQGMADALAVKGSALTYDDILLWNMTTDADLFYFHPNVVDSGKPGIRHPYPPAACTSFTAFGKATKDNTLVFAKNMDFFANPVSQKNPIVMVADPSDGGHGFFVPMLPGILAIESGMNEVGIALGLMYSGSQPETMQGLGIHFLTRIILQYADSIDDAVNLLTVYPRATSLVYHVADAKKSRAACIEVTPNEIAVRYPEEGRGVLWSSNHFNCYPGWQGYTGYNMVTNQAKAYGLADVSTIEKWQDSLEKSFLQDGKMGRYGRLEQLLKENYGNITVEKAIEIISDRYDIKTERVIPWTEVFGFTTVSMFCAKNDILSKDVLYYKSVKRGPLTASLGNMWSFVAVPSTGDIRIAMAGQIPAQQEPYNYLNLLEELGRCQ